jgi:hypothetical protein
VAIETNSKIGLISKALILLGEEPLGALADDRYGATVGGNLFELFYENEVQSGAWRFCVKKRSLNQLVDSPLNQWQYAYQLPTDCLLPRGVWPFGTPYDIYGQHLYTDAAAVDLEYLYKPDVDKIPAYFALLMVYKLAADMAKPITESDAHAKKWASAYTMQRNRAEYADAQSRPATEVLDSPFTDVRG